MLRHAMVFSTAAVALSCGLAGKEFTVKRTVNVHAKSTDPKCQTDNLTFNLADDKAFNDVKANIGKLELRKVRVTVTNPKTDSSSVATSGNGSLKVSASSTGTKLEIGTYADVPIADGSGQDLSFNKDAADQIINLGLNPPNTFFVESNACANAVPAFFDFSVEFTFYANLKI